VKRRKQKQMHKNLQGPSHRPLFCFSFYAHVFILFYFFAVAVAVALFHEGRETNN
jgi:hypothetical protein